MDNTSTSSSVTSLNASDYSVTTEAGDHDVTSWTSAATRYVTSAVTRLVQEVAYDVGGGNNSDVTSNGVVDGKKTELSVDVFQLNLTWSELQAILQGKTTASENNAQDVTSAVAEDLHALAYVIAIVLFYATVLMVVVGMHVRGKRNSFDEEHYAALLNREEMARKEKFFIHKLNILKMRALKDAPLIDRMPVHTV